MEGTIRVLSVAATETAIEPARLEAESDSLALLTEPTAHAAIRRLETDTIHCVLAPLSLPETDVIGFLDHLRTRWPTVPVIVHADADDTVTVEQALTAGATDYLPADPPADRHALLATRITNAATTAHHQHDTARSTGYYRTLLAHTADYVMVVDTAGRIEYVSPAIERVMGYSSEDLTGTDAFSTIHPDDQHQAANAFANILDEPDGEQTVQFRSETADGNWRWLEVRGRNRLQDPTIQGIIVTVRDITDRKQREQELELRNRAIEAAPVGITISDADQPDNPIVDVNETFERITGYDAADMIGHNHRILQGEATAPEPVAEMRAAIDADEPVTVELRNYRKDGELFWNRVSIAPVYDDAGDVTNYVGFQQDITELQERQQVALRNERRFTALFTDPQLLIGLLDTDGTLVDANATALEYVDVELEDVVGMEFWRTPWWSDDLRPVVREKVEQAATGEYVRYEADLTDHEGDPYSVLGVIRPVRDSAGDVTSLVVSARDITDRVKREQQLEVMDRVLRHNVHNEMSIILGAAETLAEQTDADVTEFVEMIQESGRQLLGITDKQRDIVEVVSEGSELRTEAVGRLVQQAVASVRARYPRAEVVFGDTEDAPVRAIPRLGRAVAELIENAIVHAVGDAPTVEVSVTATAGHVRICVVDSNAMIPESERAILRGDGERGPLFHGSGMGLLLVNWIVSACDGRVTYEERSPTGNEVTIELPVSGHDSRGSSSEASD